MYEVKWHKKDGSVATMWEVMSMMGKTDYSRVDETTLRDGKLISTVWLGLDHSFGRGKPLIFETMVFSSHKGKGKLDEERYSTEKEAKIGHKRMVERWSKKK